MAMGENGDAAQAGAQARFALFMASLFQRAGIVPMSEFATLLGAFAETVAETDVAESAILTSWADTIARIASH